MPNLHVIIGDPDTRKSSLMRCLVGVGRVIHGTSMCWEVALARGSSIEVFCKVASLQEGAHAMNPDQFMTFIKNLRPTPSEVLIALRVYGGNFPNAVGYLTAFRAAAWPIVSVALMDRTAIGLATTGVLPAGVRVASVPGSSTAPTNESASIVRKAWGWV